MNEVFLAVGVAIFLSAVTVLADFFVNGASMQAAFSGWKLLLLGATIYGLTAVGWFFVMKKIKLSTLAVVYGTTCIILLVLISVFYFKEKINAIEIFGVILAIISLLILTRFA